MLKNLTLENSTIAKVGEEIGLQLGNEMINSYQAANPNDTFSYEIGRNIIDQILAQPGCAGLKFFNAYNEKGEKTLVYVGLDNQSKAIVELVSVDPLGKITKEKGIVADRVRVPYDNDTLADSDNWGWAID